MMTIRTLAAGMLATTRHLLFDLGRLSKVMPKAAGGAFSLLLLVCSASMTNATTLNFQFSFSTTKVCGYCGEISGTVTGRIIGLADNNTGPASQVLIDGFPTGLNSIYGSGPIDATLWANQIANSFTTSGGNVVDGQFLANIPGHLGYYAELDLNYGGNHDNFLSLNGYNSLDVWDQGGLPGLHLTSLATPLPAALPLFASGLGGLGLLTWRRKRKNAAALTAA
jgi:hypothetical protein